MAFCFIFADSFFCCCSLLNTLKATSTNQEGFIPNAPSNFCNCLLISEALCPPQKGQIYHSNILRGLKICIKMMSVGLINPSQKFREVFICFCFVLFLLLWFPFSKPCQDALISSALTRAFLPLWGPNLVQLWVLPSGFQV